MENNSNLIKCTNLNENKDSNKTPEIAESKSEKNNLEQKNKNNKENVESEKGIIIQEINMCDDRPSDILYDKIRLNTIKENPDILFEKMNEKRLVFLGIYVI